MFVDWADCCITFVDCMTVTLNSYSIVNDFLTIQPVRDEQGGKVLRNLIFNW